MSCIALLGTHDVRIINHLLLEHARAWSQRRDGSGDSSSIYYLDSIAVRKFPIFSSGRITSVPTYALFFFIMIKTHRKNRFRLKIPVMYQKTFRGRFRSRRPSGAAYISVTKCCCRVNAFDVFQLIAHSHGSARVL